MTYSTYGKQAIRTIKRNFTNTLKTTPTTKYFRILTAFKKKKTNLQQLLIRAKISPEAREGEENPERGNNYSRRVKHTKKTTRN